MVQQAPGNFSDSEWERGLWWMVLVSAVLHLTVIAVVLLMPRSFLPPPSKLMSYSVDLVAPDRVGGTNLIEGGKGRVQAAPMAAAAPKVEPPPPPAKREEVQPPPPQPEPPKVEPEKPKEVVTKPEPPAPLPPPEPPHEDEAAFADKAREVAPQPVATVVPQAPPKAVAKAEPPTPQPTVPTKAQIEAAKKQAAEEVAAKKKAAEDAALKKAVETAAKKAAAEAAAKEAAAHARDDRILAAVKRAEQQVGERGGGTGSTAGARPGGPISVGPGEGAGGQPFGLDFVLYLGQVERRIKENWAWPGTDPALEAVVRFSITETGDVVNVRITKPSGDKSYDASVERAVRSISPMPPPPETYRKQFSDMEYTFTPQSLQM